jgi:shikimate dehydrogenase
MGTPWAEVIGDPIAQSQSPLIYGAWLAARGIAGEFRATRVAAAELARVLATRRADPDWRGCSVTIPHKRAVMAHLDARAPAAEAVGAVNCVWREGARLIGTNTDIDGVMAAFDRHGWRGGVVVLIGAGGAARAALAALRQRGAKRVRIVARDAPAALALAAGFGVAAEVFSFARADRALAGADFVINATPLGMNSMPPMPDALLDALAGATASGIVFDMVYAPLETGLLRRADSLSLATVTGLTMLIGQARAAFRLFFGAEAPADDSALLARLAR